MRLILFLYSSICCLNFSYSQGKEKEELQFRLLMKTSHSYTYPKIKGYKDLTIQNKLNLLLKENHTNENSSDYIVIHKLNFLSNLVLTISTEITDDYWMDGTMMGHGGYETSYNLITGDSLRFNDVFAQGSRDSVLAIAVLEITDIFPSCNGVEALAPYLDQLVVCDNVVYLRTDCSAFSNYNRSQVIYESLSVDQIGKFLRPEIRNLFHE